MSKFGQFAIGKDFAKTFSNNVRDKKIIKWDILPTKNQNNQYEIIYEYEEINSLK